MNENESIKASERKLAASSSTLHAVREELRRCIVGQEEVLDELLVCLVAGGHALVEGVPGLGKTTMIKVLSGILDLSFSRIQCTPDIMPADIIGTHILIPNGSGANDIQFRKGPVFTNVLFADEINRATPKTQSALLEAMQEKNVTVGGTRYPLPDPFLVCATQNPIEMEGTYPLPEAQLDRFFFKIIINRPSPGEVLQIIDRTTGYEQAEPHSTASIEQLREIRETVLRIPAAPEVKNYAVRICEASHPDGSEAEWVRYIRYGSSPRGAQALVLGGKVFAFLDGRLNLSFEDVRRASLPALRHRIILSFRGEAEGIETEGIIEYILQNVSELE